MEEWDCEPLRSARCNPAATPSSLLQDELAAHEVFIAVPKEVSDGRSTLLWALRNLVKDGSKLTIAHVHYCPVPAIAQNRSHTSMKPEEIKEYRKQKRAKAEKSLDAYVQMAKAVTFQVACAKVIIETDDVAERLEELISLNNVTGFVMGAAADRHFSREMNTPKSMTALKIFKTALHYARCGLLVKGSETGQGNPQMDMQWSMPPRGQILPPPQPGMGYWPPPPWGYPTHPMGPWGRPSWQTQPLPSPAIPALIK